MLLLLLLLLPSLALVIHIMVVMLGYADVVTSIGSAFGDAVVGVGNLQPLLHLVSPDHYPPLYSCTHFNNDVNNLQRAINWMLLCQKAE